MTAAATTGPASGPLPASSQPQTKSSPSFRKEISKSQSSERAGKSAAKYVLGETVDSDDTIAVFNGANVSYTVPQRINRQNVEKSVSVFFRVRKKIRLGEICVESEGEKIASFKREFLAPAEMQMITLPKVLLDKAQGNITVTAIEMEEEAE